jgi:hypothetical protein
VTTVLVHINNCMNKYLATVRVKGQTVRTMVFADSSLHARLILEYQFGIGNVVSNPTLSSKANEDYTPLDEVIGTIKPIKPMNPQQAKLDSLKKQKEVASNNLKAERNRQKVVKAQQQIRIATTQKPAA